MSTAAVAIGAIITIIFFSAVVVIGGGAAAIDDAFLRLLGGHFVL